MKTEKEKMLAGHIYNSEDPQLVQERYDARLLINQLNSTEDCCPVKRRKILSTLLPNVSADIWIETPFFCDYGYNIYCAEKVFLNFNCVLLDVMPIRIGSHVLFGPSVQIYTATHPIDYLERRTNLELAKPITIGNDSWIGGGVVICPGITIGDRSIVGAGSVVTTDIPADSIVAGNPAKVIRANQSLQT